MINISDIGYDVELVTEDWTSYSLNNALQSLRWEEKEGELAQRATLNIANATAGDSWLAEKAKLNCIIRIYYKLPGEKNLLFEGYIWDWEYSSSSKNEVSVTAYDNLIRMQQSKDFRYYSSGMNTKAIIGDICNDWGIPLSYKWGQSIIHGKKQFNADTVNEMIKSLLEEVKERTGEKYVTYYRDGQLQIVGYGSNNIVYRFSTENTISTANQLSLGNLVTKVKVIGKEDKKGRAPVDAVLEGDLRYGVLQEIVRRDSNISLEEAKESADTILQERGKPDENIQVNAPDVPFIRKGDAVDIEAGNLTGRFYVEGILHNAESRQMTMTLTRTSQKSVTKHRRPMLKNGSSGQDVSDMQNLLLEHGQKLPIYGADGMFGNETERAVKNFQKSNGLAVDGICGPKTWAALEG